MAYWVTVEGGIGYLGVEPLVDSYEIVELREPRGDWYAEMEYDNT